MISQVLWLYRRVRRRKRCELIGSSLPRWKDHRGGVTDPRGPTEDVVFPLRASAHDRRAFQNPAGLWTSKRQNPLWKMVVEAPPTSDTPKPSWFLLCADTFLLRGRPALLECRGSPLWMGVLVRALFLNNCWDSRYLSQQRLHLISHEKNPTDCKIHFCNGLLLKVISHLCNLYMSCTFQIDLQFIPN